MARVVGVTALFDIGRATRGRPLDDYWEWLLRTVGLAHVDMHVFLHDALAPRVPQLLAARPAGHATHVHVMRLEEVPLWRDVRRVEAILKQGQAARASALAERARRDPESTVEPPRTDTNWLVDGSHAAVFEYNNPSYAPLIASKPAFVVRAIDADVRAARGAAELYMWIDAGMARYVDARALGGPPRAAAVARALREDAVLLTERPCLATYAGAGLKTLCGYGGGGVAAGLLLGPPTRWRELRAATEASWEAALSFGRACNEQTLWSALHVAGVSRSYLCPIKGVEENTAWGGWPPTWFPMVYWALDLRRGDGGGDGDAS